MLISKKFIVLYLDGYKFLFSIRNGIIYQINTIRLFLQIITLFKN